MVNKSDVFSLQSHVGQELPIWRIKWSWNI